jgi:hypothetical protein
MKVSNYEKVEVIKNDPNENPTLEQEAAMMEETNAPQEQEGVEPVTDETTEERPEWLPEKFTSPEELAKAYQELQSAYSKKDQEKTEEQPESTPESYANFFNGGYEEYTTELSETGTISEESRERIANQINIPREFIDQYIEGQQASLNVHMNSVYGTVGGEENYDAMIEWASTELTEQEQDVFNNVVMQGTNEEMLFAVKNLSSRWKESAGMARPLIQGDTGSKGASGAFRSLAELTEAMKDPRYRKDPAYRRDVESRLSSSNIL